MMRDVIAPAPYNVHLQPVHTHLAAHAIRAMSFNLVKSSQVKFDHALVDFDGGHGRVALEEMARNCTLGLAR